MIHASWPGLAAEEWTSPAALEGDPRFAPILDAWRTRSAAWVGGERNPSAVDLRFTAVELVPAARAAQARPLLLGPGTARPPWRFDWASAPAMALEWRAGPAPVARLSGDLRARDEARATIDLAGDRAPIDVAGYDAVRMRVSGTGTFRVRAIQPSVTDGDDYASAAFTTTGEPRDVVVPLRDLRQAGWGVQTPFTPDEVTALVIEPLLGPEGARPPAGLYHAMVRPLVPYAISGALWYQGESNASRGPQYRALLPALIRSWRAAWGQGDFPFLVVQLPNYRSRSPLPQESGWAELREAQLMTLQVANTGLAVTIDAGEAEDIHPANKRPVGERLARWALGAVHGRPGESSGPLFESVRFDGPAARLRFTHTGSGLTTADHRELRGFAIAGADRRFVWARAAIDGDTVVVGHPDVAQAVAVRYAWADNPDANLANREGLPASPFRTDTWERPATPPPAGPR